MPRYYFDLRDGRGLHRDMIGEDFEDFEEARAQTQALLGDIAREELPGGELHTFTCDLRDEADRVVYHGEFTYRGTRFLE